MTAVEVKRGGCCLKEGSGGDRWRQGASAVEMVEMAANEVEKQAVLAMAMG